MVIRRNRSEWEDRNGDSGRASLVFARPLATLETGSAMSVATLSLKASGGLHERADVKDESDEGGKRRLGTVAAQTSDGTPNFMAEALAQTPDTLS